jgi:hypothetical protein
LITLIDTTTALYVLYCCRVPLPNILAEPEIVAGGRGGPSMIGGELKIYGWEGYFDLLDGF